MDDKDISYQVPLFSSNLTSVQYNWQSSVQKSEIKQRYRDSRAYESEADLKRQSRTKVDKRTLF